MTIDNIKATKRMKAALIACGSYMFLSFFHYHIDKFFRGVPYYILEFTLLLGFIILTVLFFVQTVDIYRNRKALTFKFCLPAILILLNILYILLFPFRLSSERFESQVVLRGCFEGTQNQASIKFRSNQSFEIHWTGAFGYNDWFYGEYEKFGDTLILHYQTEEPLRFGDTILVNDHGFSPINKVDKPDKTYMVGFYLGYCQGYN